MSLLRSLFMQIMKMLRWPSNTIRRSYGWMLKWAQTRFAERALAGFAFMESSFFPIPPDPLLIAIASASKRSWIRLALITTAASVAGALLGYIIGIGLFESIGQGIINTYGLHEEFVIIASRYEANAFLTIFTAAFTPIPYKLITIAAGVFHVNIIILIIASILGRGMRFTAVAWASHHFGKRYQSQITRYIDVLSLAFIALLILGFVAIKYLL